MLANKNVVGMLAAAIVLFLGGVYYLSTLVRSAGDFWPFENEPGSLVAGISGLQRDIANLQAEIKKIPEAKERLAGITSEYDLATRVLPRENSPDQLIAAINTKTYQAGVIPTRLVPRAARAPSQPGGRQRGGGSTPSFEEWTFELLITGTYDQIGTFVNYMEEFESTDTARTGSEKRFFQVQSIDITAQDNGLGFIGGSGETGAERQRHQCRLVMQTYRYTGSE
ncbi:MAG: hypothetical protein LBE84_03770 [Planctomycetota bacterium]|jgi:Tfp pilus assembly protein PilO|nr:hypothetical protein [Planctomycetota bacterium]